MKTKFLLLSCAGFLLLVLVRHVFEPYMVANNYFDYYISDLLPVFLAIPTIYCFSFIFTDINKSKKSYNLIFLLILSVGVIAVNISREGFDLKNMIALLAGVLTTYLIIVKMGTKKI